MPQCFLSRRLALVSSLAFASVTIPAANAGCADYSGLIQVCFKGSCEIQKMVRHCSSTMAGNQWISDKGYEFSYSRSIDNRWSLLEVIYQPYEQILYKGDPDMSPYTFNICGEDRNVGGPCSAKSWAKGYY